MRLFILLFLVSCASQTKVEKVDCHTITKDRRVCLEESGAPHSVNPGECSKVKVKPRRTSRLGPNKW